mmetsp:Transcript_31650/g.46091  ORF Transcript_31650/g.46091 Transcript_31650/m.46091 type:complete len:279 (+) Transcript_31650:189-1025(+)|eukprot:CAMPEP_0116046528 /NCGR_PEP_ID=MMETSP0321-20121206/28330_1 /TAXON_ID=163516 /ORGANISM="Leptocylindrus danicus var. danicus, Strain B650" /LENGTH=278 /DNA_ID=CAMNT_0003528195 /DNA_START=59 /DNA_END=895 /DNA_ORIENTATION=-
MENVDETPDDEGRMNLRFGLFERIPDGVFSFVGTLTSLDLSNNRLTEISSEICSFALLRELNVSRNFINKFDEGIGGCIRLRFLDISHNRLSYIPEALFKCTMLESLNLSFNQIHELPQAVCELFVLANLDVQNNLLRNIPCELSDIPTLKNLNCCGNSEQMKATIPDGLGEDSYLVILCLKLHTSHKKARTQRITQYRLQEDLTIAEENIRLRRKEEISSLKKSLLELENDLEEARMFYQKWYDLRDRCRAKAEKVWNRISSSTVAWWNRGQKDDPS